MKFLQKDLHQSMIRVDESLEVNPGIVEAHPRLTALHDVFVTGHGYYNDHDQELLFDLIIEGDMVVPCAITLKPLTVNFSIPFQESFTFGSLDDLETGFEIDDEVLDLQPFLESAILADVPLKVVDPEIEDYPSGNGWVVVSEEDYIKEKSQELDPRLAKFKDFIVE